MNGEELEVIRTPWRTRLLRNTWRSPFPYFLHRWTVNALPDVDGRGGGFCAGFVWRRTAERYVADYEAITEADLEAYMLREEES